MKADGQRLQSLPLPGGATEQLCHHCPLQTRMVRALDSPSPHCWMRLPQEGSTPGDPRSLWKTRDLGTADSWRPSTDHTPWSWAAGSSLMGVGESVVNDFLLNVLGADAINACSTFLQPTLEFICSCGGFFLCRLIASPFCCSGQLTPSYRQHTYTPHTTWKKTVVFSDVRFWEIWGPEFATELWIQGMDWHCWKKLTHSREGFVPVFLMNKIPLPYSYNLSGLWHVGAGIFPPFQLQY